MRKFFLVSFALFAADDFVMFVAYGEWAGLLAGLLVGYFGVRHTLPALGPVAVIDPMVHAEAELAILEAECCGFGGGGAGGPSKVMKEEGRPGIIEIHYTPIDRRRLN